MRCYYFLLLPISQRIRKTTSATPITPVQIPALKIPAMASQLLRPMVNTKSDAAAANDNLFMMLFFVSDYCCSCLWL
jgi:hypothetical protein